MRVYHADGTYTDDADDDEFGWYLADIVVDEAVSGFTEENKRTKELAAIKKSIRKELKNNLQLTVDESAANLSRYRKPIIIQRPNIKIQPIRDVLNCKMSVEGPFEDEYVSDFERELKHIDINFPSKEKLASLINPCNPEAKILLSVISYTRYKNLENKKASDTIFNSINFRTTKYNHLINGDQVIVPDFKYLINDAEVDSEKEMFDEIQNYHETKEDNMLSLMMELIITDLDSSLGDMSDLNQCINDINNSQPVQETSDFGNSIQSNFSSKNFAKRDFLEVPNRSEILSSIGLSEDIDKSIQSWTEEKNEMHKELIEIKEGFQEDEIRVDRLLEEASALEKDLRETLYLDNLILLLKGETGKVKNIKWPFRVFHGPLSEDVNLII